MSSEHVRQHIEIAIDRARERVSDRIDELDSRLRVNLDARSLAAEHAPQFLATGAVFGLLLGLGVPKLVLRSVQIGVPIWLAVRIVKSRAASSATVYPGPVTAAPPPVDDLEPATAAPAAIRLERVTGAPPAVPDPEEETETPRHGDPLR